MTVKVYLQTIGRRGGLVGGKSTSPAKRRASRLNAAKARAAKEAKNGN